MEILIVLFIVFIIAVIYSTGGRLDDFLHSAWRKAAGKPSKYKIDPDKFDIVNGEIVEKKTGYKLVVYEVVCPYCGSSFIKRFSEDLKRVECKTCGRGFASDDFKLHPYGNQNKEISIQEI